MMKIPPLEKEVKFFINDPASFEERLRRLGASVKQPRTHELNYRFDTHDLDLTHSHKVLRIRKDNQVILAYKVLPFPILNCASAPRSNWWSTTLTMRSPSSKRLVILLWFNTKNGVPFIY